MLKNLFTCRVILNLSLLRSVCFFMYFFCLKLNAMREKVVMLKITLYAMQNCHFVIFSFWKIHFCSQLFLHNTRVLTGSNISLIDLQNKRTLNLGSLSCLKNNIILNQKIVTWKTLYFISYYWPLWIFIFQLSL